MRRLGFPSRSRFLGLCYLGALLVSTAGLRSADQDRWWPDYAGGPASARYFEGNQISRANVGKLEVAWTYPYGETGSNPIVVGGVVYGRGRNGSLLALDAKTGREIWIREGMQAMTARGMNYWESKDGKDRRLIFSMTDYLQEINAATGQPIYAFGKDGVVDLREASAAILPPSAVSSRGRRAGSSRTCSCSGRPRAKPTCHRRGISGRST